MVWYNPLTWFKTEEGEIRCNNPDCNGLIKGDSIVYSPEHKEFYHRGQCPIFANAYRALQSRSVVRGEFEIISRRKALQIQKGLEQKVNSLNPLSD